MRAAQRREAPRRAAAAAAARAAARQRQGRRAPGRSSRRLPHHPSGNTPQTGRPPRTGRPWSGWKGRWRWAGGGGGGMVRQQSCSARRPGERGPRRRHHGWRGRPGNGGRGRGHRRRGCEDAGARTERESGGSPARAWWRGPFRLVLFCFVCGANWHPPASSPSSHPFTPRPRLARQCTTPWTVNDQAKGGRRPRPGYPAPIKALPDSCRTENKQKWLLSFSIHSLSYLLTDPTIPGCRPQDGLYVRDAALGGVGWMEGRRLCQPFVRLEQSGGLVEPIALSPLYPLMSLLSPGRTRNPRVTGSGCGRPCGCVGGLRAGE